MGMGVLALYYLWAYTGYCGAADLVLIAFLFDAGTLGPTFSKDWWSWISLACEDFCGTFDFLSAKALIFSNGLIFD